MHLQPIYDIAELCARKGLQSAVLCPGSRCAPLTLAFTRHGKIRCYTFSDERSAAFIALGMAQQTKLPVTLLCTSGTAVYNFAPAVAEAFFSQTPLIVFTADRPAEWIAQHDGQTVYQHEIFGKHVKKSYNLPQHYDHPDDQWHINRVINEAINTANAEPKGPVHINAPFREPFYPHPSEKFQYGTTVRVIEQHSDYVLSENSKSRLSAELSNYKKILIVAGQSEYDTQLIQALEKLTRQVPLVADVVSNLHGLNDAIRYADAFLQRPGDKEKKILQPDLLITFGKSVLSKNLKLFLRSFRPSAHWHIQPAGVTTDPFQGVTQIIHTTPVHFFDFLAGHAFSSSPAFFQNWKTADKRVEVQLKNFFPQNELSELELVWRLLEHLPPGSNLHLANSMSVRYANYIGLTAQQKEIRVFSNRGTSGIDGCTSTAVGHALTSEVLNTLITGDLAFFYDRNAFWHNYPLPNLRVMLLNNHGGIIFKLIDGPAGLPEADEYFVTRQPLTAKTLCEEFGFEYLPVTTAERLPVLIRQFYEPGQKPKILEFQSNLNQNKTIFERFKLKLSQYHET